MGDDLDQVVVGVRRVLREAMTACGRADLNRTVKQAASWAEHEDPRDEQAIERLATPATGISPARLG